MCIFTLHVTCNEEVFSLSLADQQKRIQKDALSETRDFGDSNPVVLERTLWWMISPHFGSQSRNESLVKRLGEVSVALVACSF